MWYSFHSRAVRWAPSTVVESSADNWENLAEKSVLVVEEWSLRCWQNKICINICIYLFINILLIFLCKGSADRDCVGNHCTRCRCRPFPQVLYLYLYCQVFRILRLEFSRIRRIRLLGEKVGQQWHRYLYWFMYLFICICIFACICICICKGGLWKSGPVVRGSNWGRVFTLNWALATSSHLPPRHHCAEN